MKMKLGRTWHKKRMKVERTGFEKIVETVARMEIDIASADLIIDAMLKMQEERQRPISMHGNNSLKQLWKALEDAAMGSCSHPETAELRLDYLQRKQGEVR